MKFLLLSGAAAIALTGTVVALWSQPNCACGKLPAAETLQAFTPRAKTTAAASFANPRPLTAENTRQLKQLFAQENWLPKQSFRVKLPEFGECLFVSVVDYSANRLKLHIVKNGRIVYTLPELAQPKSWRIHDVRAVTFTELNFDGGDADIILISEYTAGPGGPGTSPPFPVTIVYETYGQGYRVDEGASRLLTKRQVKTIAEAETILRNELNYLP